MSEKLHPHLLEIDWTAQERVDTMLPHMMEAAGVTEAVSYTHLLRLFHRFPVLPCLPLLS